MTRMVMCSNPSLASSLDICLGTCYGRLGQDESQFPGCWALTVSLLYNSTVSQQTAPHCTKEFLCPTSFPFWSQGSSCHPTPFFPLFPSFKKEHSHPLQQYFPNVVLEQHQHDRGTCQKRQTSGPTQAYKWESHVLQLWPGAQEPVLILLVILRQLKCENHLPSFRVESGCPTLC